MQVLIVKLADRLHNMRTVWALQPVKARDFARETLQIWCPMCECLGLSAVKAELEDICLAVYAGPAFRALHRQREVMLGAAQVLSAASSRLVRFACLVACDSTLLCRAAQLMSLPRMRDLTAVKRKTEEAWRRPALAASLPRRLPQLTTRPKPVAWTRQQLGRRGPLVVSARSSSCCETTSSWSSRSVPTPS